MRYALLRVKCKAKLKTINPRNTQKSTFDINERVIAVVSTPSALTPIAATKNAIAQPNMTKRPSCLRRFL